MEIGLHGIAEQLKGAFANAPPLGVLVFAASALTTPALMIAGLAPRLGPVRALRLGLRTRLPFIRPDITVHSCRSQDVATVRARILSLPGGCFQVIGGPSGVGKSTVVDTAVHAFPGVIRIEVSIGATYSQILAAAQSKITGYKWRYLDLEIGARRVAKWHRWIFRRPLVLVFAVAEHPAGTEVKDYAQIAPAARALSLAGCSVIVDASDHSLPPDAKATLREATMSLEPLPREAIASLSQLKDLHASLEKAELSDVAWEVLGGVPSSYVTLSGLVDDTNAATVVRDALNEHLRKANSTVNTALATQPSLAPLFDEFKRDQLVPEHYFATRRIPEPVPNKVLRRKVDPQDEGNFVLVPSSPAMGLVLKHRVGGKGPRIDSKNRLAPHKAPVSLSP